MPACARRPAARRASARLARDSAPSPLLSHSQLPPLPSPFSFTAAPSPLSSLIHSCSSYPFECRTDNLTTWYARYPRLAANRLQPLGNAFLLDGNPFFVRAVCYSPVPAGHDPGYGEPWGDYFTSEWVDIFERDIALFVEMGARSPASSTDLH